MNKGDRQDGNMTRVAVLITCFNRRQHTLACLRSLMAQQNIAGYALEVYLLDAGADGTAEAVTAEFPAVHVIAGDADLYWAGGMRQAWQQALNNRADLYLWLNDDVQLLPDALARLLADYQQLLAAGNKVGAVVGTMAAALPIPATSATSSDRDLVASYGGRCRVSRWFPLQFGAVLQPQSEPQPCDFINGNLCLIPAAAVDAIGILSERFTHSMADYDYGLRLARAGFSLWLASGFHGVCPLHDPALSVLNKKRPFFARLRSLQRPNVWAPAGEWAYFVRCHGGPLWPLLWLKVQLRGCFPALWLWWSQRELS